MMKREIYDPDHESLRDPVRRFLDRDVRASGDESTEVKQLPREMRLAFGRQELHGMQISRQYGGSGAGDVGFNAVLCEELGKVSMSLRSGHGIHADLVPRRPRRVRGAAAPRGTSRSMDER
jgi:alkylation response protein AidB-like acyl-CoA dehydrogenase